MKLRKLISVLLTLGLVLSLFAFGGTAFAEDEITVTDMIGREVAVVPGSYQRVVCIGAGALRMYTAVRCRGYRQHLPGRAPQDV